MVSYNAFGGGNYQDAHVSGGQEFFLPVLKRVNFNWEAGFNGAAFVDSAHQLHFEFSLATVIDEFEFADVAVKLHDAQDSS
jgi:hypothetical protein